MENEGALQLLTSFLQKRGTKIDLKKDPPALYAYSRACSLFADAGDLFSESSWKALSEVLWEKVIEDDKTAKKLMKPWKEVINVIKYYQAKKKVAAVATANLERVPTARMHFLGVDYVPPKPVPSEPPAPPLPWTQSADSLPASEEAELEEEAAHYHDDDVQSYTAAAAPAAAPLLPSYREDADKHHDSSNNESNDAANTSDKKSSDSDCQNPKREPLQCTNHPKPLDHLLTEVT